MAKKPFVIVLDGPAGAGKSTVARRVASILELPYLDTGAIYRAVAWWLDSQSIPPEESDALREKLSEFRLSMTEKTISVASSRGGEERDVTDLIRSGYIDSIVSYYAALGCVREHLLDLQRQAARNGIVAEGRDMGTVVFPHADFKFFVTASPEVRARRRYDERVAKGEPADYDEILRQVIERDRIDSSREVAPLQRSGDALFIDTSDMTLDEVVSSLAGRVLSR